MMTSSIIVEVRLVELRMLICQIVNGELKSIVNYIDVVSKVFIMKIVLIDYCEYNINVLKYS